MASWQYIASMPTCVAIPRDCAGVHESTLRSYQLLQKVKDYLERGVPADVILELVAEVEAAQ